MEKHIHGGDVYHHQGCIDFSANCNPLGTPEGIKKAIIESLEHINDYPQVGCTPLKKAIAEYEGGESKTGSGAGSDFCRIPAGII